VIDRLTGFPPTRLTVKRHVLAERDLRLALAGEVDLSSVDILVRALATVPPAARTVVVDLAQVTLLDSTGIAALLAAYRSAASAGRTFTVVNARDVVRRALEVTGVLSVLSAEPALDDG
jgi:anti-sigma B factor antagonist